MNHINCVTVRSSVSNHWLNQKMYQITFGLQQQLSDGVYPVHTASDHNEVNNYMDCNWIFLQSAGDFIVDVEAVWKLLHSISDDVGIIGHILWEDYQLNPILHKQCVIINTKAIIKPINFYSKTTFGRKFIRSTEDMHGGYCPQYVYLSNEISERDPGFGTDLMSQVLENGYKVVNFNLAWRQTNSIDYYGEIPTRGYLNPEKQTELFAKCLQSLVIDENLDTSHKIAINTFKKGLEFKVLNLWHYDKMIEGADSSMIICPCNGFLGESLALKNNAKKIVFFDININNIEFKKYLYTEWNGENFQKIYTDFAAHRQLIIEPTFPTAKEISDSYQLLNEEILENWKYFKSLDIEFITGDIFKSIDYILSKLDNQSILHTSTIFNNYIWTNLRYDSNNIENIRDIIRRKIDLTNSIWMET